MPKITQAKVLIVASSGFEQSELQVPLQKLKQQGAQVHVADRGLITSRSPADLPAFVAKIVAEVERA